MRWMVLVAGCLAQPVFGQSLSEVAYGDVASDGATRIEFRFGDLRSTETGLQVLGPVTFGKSFVGMVVQKARTRRYAWVDVDFGRAPQAPLRPAANPEYSLSLEFRGAPEGYVALPVGPLGTIKRGRGEGALAIFFDEDQCAFGVRVQLDQVTWHEAVDGSGTDRVLFKFFDRDGVRLGSFGYSDQIREAADGPVWISYAFRQTMGGAPQIAGVFINNLDVEGIAIDDIVFRDDCVALIG